MHGPTLNGVLCRRAGDPAQTSFLRLVRAGNSREMMRVTFLSSRRLEGAAQRQGGGRLEDDLTGACFERRVGAGGEKVNGPLISLPAEFARVALKGLIDPNHVLGYYTTGFQPFYAEPSGKPRAFGRGPIDRKQLLSDPKPIGLEIFYGRMDQLSLYQRVVGNMKKAEFIDWGSDAFAPLFWRYLDFLLPLLSVAIPGTRCYYPGQSVPPGSLIASPGSAEGLLREKVRFAADLLFHFTPTYDRIKTLLTP